MSETPPLFGCVTTRYPRCLSSARHVSSQPELGTDHIAINDAVSHGDARTGARQASAPPPDCSGVANSAEHRRGIDTVPADLRGRDRGRQLSRYR